MTISKTARLARELEGIPQFYESARIEIEDIPLEFPNKSITWQRRVIAHMLPDSPRPDAPEKILYRILAALTSDEKTEFGFDVAFHGDYSSLRDLFQATTQQRNTVPVAFHVLMVKARDMRIQAYLTERTFHLLCADENGCVDGKLIAELVERFRTSLDDLDLASRVVLRRLHPGWTQDQFRPTVNSDARVLPPFMPDAGRLFRRDLRTLLDSGASPADFFELLTQTLTLHLGLYQPRLASRLNPAMRELMDEFADPGSAHVDQMRRIEAGHHQEHRFDGRFNIRAPSPGLQRPLPRSSATRISYVDLERDLTELHFSLLLFNQVMQLAREFIVADFAPVPDKDMNGFAPAPSMLAAGMQTRPRLRRFLQRATLALALRYVRDQLPGELHDHYRERIDSEPSGLHALRSLYHDYNRTEPNTEKSNLAMRQGIGTSDSLLGRGDRGLIQSRQGVGKYLEIGVGLLPLLLLLAVGARSEKVQLSTFWARLAEYGLCLDPEERQLLLVRLKTMGLYERFSDAGEANYVRNLLAGNNKNSEVGY